MVENFQKKISFFFPADCCRWPFVKVTVKNGRRFIIWILLFEFYYLNWLETATSTSNQNRILKSINQSNFSNWRHSDSRRIHFAYTVRQRHLPAYQDDIIPQFYANDIKIASKWHQLDIKMTQKWHQNWIRISSKLHKKRHQNGIKIASEWHKNDIKIASEWHKNDIKIAPEWHKNDIKIASELHQNGIKMTLKWR